MTPFYATAEDAEEAFYEAIARADLDALMAVWSEDEDIVCIHPTGQRMDGTRRSARAGARSSKATRASRCTSVARCAGKAC